MPTAVPKVKLEIDGASIKVSIKNQNAELIQVYPDVSVKTEAAYIAFAKELARILELPVKATRKVTACTTTTEVFDV